MTKDKALKLVEIPEPPPECQTEAEKTAFAFGWFKAMEVQRNGSPMKADIIQMAHEAGWPMGHEHEHHDDPFYIRLERFAQLVAAQCAEIANTAEPYKADDLIRKHFGVDDETRTGAT